MDVVGAREGVRPKRKEECVGMRRVEAPTRMRAEARRERETVVGLERDIFEVGGSGGWVCGSLCVFGGRAGRPRWGLREGNGDSEFQMQSVEE